MSQLSGNRSLLSTIYTSLLIVAYGWLYCNVFDEDVELMGDNATFYILGKALYQGAGYVHINSPDTLPANNMPPGYPLLIAVTMALWSTEIAAIKMVNGLAFLLAALTAFYLFRRLSDNVHVAFLAAAAMLVNGHLLRYSTLIMSEIPFLLWTLIALWAVTYLGPQNFRRWAIYVMVFCLIAAYYTRTAGIALCFGVGLTLLWRRQWRYLFFCAGACGAAMLPWILRSQHLNSGGYVAQFLMINPYRPALGSLGPVDLVRRLLANAERYLSLEVPDALLYFIADDALERAISMTTWAQGVVLLTLSAVGMCRVRRHRDLVVAFLAAYTLMILLWPDVWVGTRFLLPLIPLLLLLVVLGLWGLMTWSMCVMGVSRYNHPLLLSPLLFYYAADVDYLHRVAVDGVVPASWVNYFKVAKWVDGNLPKDIVLACRKPSLFHLYANRQTVMYSFTKDPAELIADLESKGVDYVVLEQLGYSSQRLYLIPAIMANLGRFSLVYEIAEPPTGLMAFKPRL